MMDEHEWRSVLQIVKDGTLSTAAKHLFVSQPSLSQCVKKIERELGMQIFSRTQMPLQLTEAGRIYVQAAEQMRQIHQSILQQVDDLSELRSGSVRVGSSRTRSVCLLTGAIVAFHRRYPQIQLSVLEASTAKLREHVLKGNVDFALLHEPLPGHLFHAVPILEEHVLLAVPQEHPFAQKFGGVQPHPYPQISFARFHQEAFVALKPSRRMSAIYEDLCARTQATPNIVFEADSILGAAELCAQGMGATLVTDMVVGRRLWDRPPFIFEIAEPVEPRLLVAAYGRQATLSRAAQVFLEFLHGEA